MSTWNPFDADRLARQVKRQREQAWDLDTDIQWDLSVDPTKYFLPLDEDSIAFPGANEEQRVALSQLMGLLINSTISEMESTINRLREPAWEDVLRRYPINPEMWELGELFFEEEKKHALLFQRYNHEFCQATGIDPVELQSILPNAFGSRFIKAILSNAREGGHAFWWVVGSVEEVSVEIYRPIHEHRDEVDPLFHEVHRRHLEDESRHRNYAFLMLELIECQKPKLKEQWRRKTDLLLSQICTTGWVLGQLSKIFEVRRLASTHAFFDTLASCLPLLERLSLKDLASRFFVSAPYISLMLNLKNHRKTFEMSVRHSIPRLPHPDPINKATLLKKASKK